MDCPSPSRTFEPAVGFPFTRGSPIYKDFMPQRGFASSGTIAQGGRATHRQDECARVCDGLADLQQSLWHHFQSLRSEQERRWFQWGAAAALACGLLPIADGSDLGGSLRNPANFNNIVALRPTVGLVPTAPNPMPFIGFGVKGPMARSVVDTAFLLSVIAGPDLRDPACYPSDPTSLHQAARAQLQGCARGVVP